MDREAARRCQPADAKLHRLSVDQSIRSTWRDSARPMRNLKTLLLGARNQIGRRLIVSIIAFSSLITLCISAVQLFTEYRGLRSELDQQLNSVRIYVPSIAKSVWDFDQEQVQRALDALTLLPNIAQVTITTPGARTQWNAGRSISSNFVTQTYSLRHEVRGTDTEIGSLNVIASLDGIYRQVMASAVSIILSNGLKTFLVALFMVYLIRRLITTRLEKMALKVHTLIPGILPLRLVVEHEPQPIPESLDELDAVDWTLDKTAEDLGIAVAALTELNAKLEHRVEERTQEIESFAYTVSHDLRAPLRAIDGFSKILVEDYESQLDDEGRRLLNVVRANTARMSTLIDDILEFSRMGRREMGTVTVNMENLVRSVFKDLQSSVGERNLSLDIKALPAAMGDHAMLRQVIENLLTNAIKFTQPRESALIEVSATTEGGECIYSVSDNGVGFDMHYVGKLFNVFERLHSIHEFEGTGIGLAIVKRIVTRHGGRVWAESQLGERTAIYFTLVPAA